MKNTKTNRNSSGAGRNFKKRPSPLVFEENEFIDYKNVDLLKKFMSDRAKIRPREVTGNTVQQQREIALAIKNAREMGLLAYTSAVTTQRKGSRGRDRDDDKRSSRKDGPRDKKNEDSSQNSPSVVADKSPKVEDAPETQATAAAQE